MDYEKIDDLYAKAKNYVCEALEGVKTLLYGDKLAYAFVENSSVNSAVIDGAGLEGLFDNFVFSIASRKKARSKKKRPKGGVRESRRKRNLHIKKSAK